jgi:hypothetical protein
MIAGSLSYAHSIPCTPAESGTPHIIPALHNALHDAVITRFQLLIRATSHARRGTLWNTWSIHKRRAWLVETAMHLAGV